MRRVFLIAFVALVALIFALNAKKGSDKISAFKDCVATCRGQKNSFRFCASFCKPNNKPAAPSKKTVKAKKPTAAPAIPAIAQKDGKEILRQVLGDNYDEQSDAAQNLNVPDSRGLWEKYRTVLKDFFRQGNPNALPGLQLVPNPFPADWDLQPEILSNLCNRIPKWGAVYEPRYVN